MARDSLRSLRRCSIECGTRRLRFRVFTARCTFPTLLKGYIVRICRPRSIPCRVRASCGMISGGACMAVRLKDIARDLGVSVVTVSNVLRGNADIGEVTRKRVLKRMKELNYQPNMMARGRARGRT